MLPEVNQNASGRLLRAGLLTAATDGLFACALTFVYGTRIVRLWQGVAATLVGPAAFDAGIRGAALGVLMHVGVAFGWSAVFLFLVLRWTAVRRLLASRHGVVKAAAAYGPFIWLVMSLAVIPVLLQRPPSITPRWWIQLVGHFPFVGLPIVASIGKPPGHSPARL